MGFFEGATAVNQDILGLTMLLSGLFVCFFGAKFFKHIIFFVGFVMGCLGSYFLVPEFLGIFSFNIRDEMLLYVSLAIGAALGILFVVIYKAAVFSCGAIAGVIVAQGIWQGIVMPLNLDDAMPYPDVFQVVGWIIFALVGGWAAFKLAEFILKGITAFIGGFMFASSVAYFISRAENNENNDVMSWLQFFTTSSSYKNINQTCNAYCWICLALWVILFFSGCYIQYKFHKKHERKHYDDDISESGEESDDELDERKQKREAMKAAKKARKGGTVQEVRDGSADMSGHAQVSSYSNHAGRPSYYSSNTQYNGYNGYNGYNANYNRQYSGYNSSGNYYSGGRV